MLLIEFRLPGGQPLGQMAAPDISPEQVYLQVLPDFRRQSGITGPVSVRMRTATPEEEAQIMQMMAQVQRR